MDRKCSLSHFVTHAAVSFGGSVELADLDAEPLDEAVPDLGSKAVSNHQPHLGRRLELALGRLVEVARHFADVLGDLKNPSVWNVIGTVPFPYRHAVIGAVSPEV